MLHYEEDSRASRRRAQGAAAPTETEITGMPPKRRRSLLLALLALALTLGLPPRAPFGAREAAAHAFLKQTQPANGSVVAATIGEVRLTFSEGVEVRPDRVAVTDSAGRRVDGRDARLAPGGEATVAVSVPQLADGVYTVRYGLFSADTHPVSGSFRFGVGVSPVDVLAGAPETGALTTAADARLDAPVLLEALGRWLNLLGLALLIGPVAFRLLVLGRPARRPRDDDDGGGEGWGGLPEPLPRLFGARLRRWVWAAIGLLFLAQLAGLLAAAAGGPEGLAGAPTSGAFGAALASRFGTVWLWRLGLLLLPALVLPLLVAEQEVQEARAAAAPPSRWEGRGWWAILAAGGGLALLTSLGGHAATTEPVPLSLLVDWVHLVAMALWLGGLVGLGLVLPPVLRSLGAREGGVALATVAPRFSALATLCVQALVLTGLYQTWAQVAGPAALTGTAYGRTLLAKLALVLPLLALGALGRATILPRLRRLAAAPGETVEATRATTRRLWRAVWAEAGLGLAVLLAVGLLTALPPARDAEAAGGDAAGGGVAGAVPNETTLAANAGPLLVALTIGPTESGPAVLSATVQDPVGAAVGDATVRLRLTREGDGATQEVPLTARAGRYVGLGELGQAGLWRIEADVAAPAGAGTARFALELPTGGARALLARADTAMNRLTSLRERETIETGAATVITEYEFVAPDRSRLRVNSGSETIAIGARRFDRGPNGLWVAGNWPLDGGYRWPRYEFARTAAEATILGREEVDGESSWIVAFLNRESGERYISWIGERDFLIRRQRMFFTGHYMDTRFSDFNAPIAIEAPEGLR